MIKKNKKKGFTLIELVIVIAILAILAAILVPSVTGYITKADNARDEANARTVYMAASLALAEEKDPTTVKPEELAASAATLSGLDASKITLGVVNGVITSVSYDSKSYTVTNGQLELSK